MTTIYLDPGQMDSTAGAIGEHAREIQTSVSTLESACSATVPVTIAAWLVEELHDIAVTAQLVALLYTVAALDTALRAQQIQADQSLVAAQPGLAATSVDLSAALAMGSVVGGGSTIGSVSTPAFSPTTMTIGGGSSVGVVSDMPTGPAFVTIGGTPTYANDPLLALASRVQNSNPALASQLLGVNSGLSDSRNASISNTLAPAGLSFVGSHTYEDEFGRQGGLGQSYRDKRTGELRF